uniref:Uncharacterized protein n=1 Tax=Arundo donax TaxID=35708 RepID=A0A0A9CW61_ARUDO
MVPFLAQKISEDIEAGIRPHPNLQVSLISLCAVVAIFTGWWTFPLNSLCCYSNWNSDFVFSCKDLLFLFCYILFFIQTSLRTVRCYVY